jgi:hypothetical protein
MVIRRRIAQDFNTYAAAQPAALTQMQKLTAYMQLVRADVARLGPLVPADERWRRDAMDVQMALAETEFGNLAPAPAAAAVQTFVTDYLAAVVEAVNEIEDFLAARQNAAVAAEQEAEEARNAWIYEDAQYPARLPAGVAEDLDKLLGQCPPMHQSKVHTLVGGSEAKGKGVKKIAGLVNPSARIDVQAPLRQRPVQIYNIQYQVGGATIAGLLFTQEDLEAALHREMRESLRLHQKAVSPSAERARRA